MKTLIATVLVLSFVSSVLAQNSEPSPPYDYELQDGSWKNINYQEGIMDPVLSTDDMSREEMVERIRKLQRVLSTENYIVTVLRHAYSVNIKVSREQIIDLETQLDTFNRKEEEKARSKALQARILGVITAIFLFFVVVGVVTLVVRKKFGW